MGKILLGLVLSVLVAQGHSLWQHRSGNVPPPPSKLSKDAFLRSTGWFTQKLDHFDQGNSQTWQQMYYAEDNRSDKSNGKVAFLMSSGDGSASPSWMSNSAWADYAQEFNAVFFQLETRFHGLSRPTEDTTLGNLKYLTTEQILEDSADFIKAMNKEYNLDSDVKWIALGGFYGGTLAAWLREKHPELVHAAISTGAPLEAVPDYGGYYKVVAEDLRNISQECYDAVGAGMNQLKDLLKDEEGRSTATSLFQLCDPLEKYINDRKSIANLFATLVDNFGRISESNDLGGIGGIDLKLVCEIMTDTAEPQEVKRLAHFNKRVNDYYYLPCTNYEYQEMLSWYKEESFGGMGTTDLRKQLYQQCNELGIFKTTSAEPHIFSDQFGLDFYVQQCIEVFGPNFNSSYLDSVTKNTNSVYGGLNPNVTNVLFIHGSFDPWHAAGVSSSLNPQSPLIYIEGASHCSDMYAASSSDSPALKAARGQIRQQIQSWLN